MTIEHHLEVVILDDRHAAFVVIGKNGFSPVACPRNEPRRESAGADGRKEQASEQGVHQLCPRNLHVRDIGNIRSEEHTSELQSLMRISYAVFCLKTKNNSAVTYTNKLTCYLPT